MPDSSKKTGQTSDGPLGIGSSHSTGEAHADANGSGTCGPRNVNPTANYLGTLGHDHRQSMGKLARTPVKVDE